MKHCYYRYHRYLLSPSLLLSFNVKNFQLNCLGNIQRQIKFKCLLNLWKCYQKYGILRFTLLRISKSISFGIKLQYHEQKFHTQTKHMIFKILIRKQENWNAMLYLGLLQRIEAPMQNDIVLFLVICNQSMCPIPFTKLECVSFSRKCVRHRIY